MPLFEFEYYDDDGKKHIFEEFYPIGYDFSDVKSPDGKFKANKLISSGITSAFGLTNAQKKAGTTKNRVDTANFMKLQREKRKKEYAPGTRQHESNELWTGTEGTDGVTEMPISKKPGE